MLPSPLTILAVVVVVFFVVLVVVRGPIDADYWWHITTGELILERAAVPTTDPFSFAYDGAWVAHEWLGEVLIHALVTTAGFPITAGLFGLATAGALLLPAAALGRHGVSVPAMLPFIAIGTYTLASFTTVRPQVLSWLLLGALIALLLGIRSERSPVPWLVPPLFLLWANLHGLWVAGVGVMAVYSLFTFLGHTPLSRGRWRAAAMLAGTLIAPALTPAGPAGLLYPLRYLRQDDWGTSFIAEWQSIDVTDPRQWGLVILFVAAVLLGRRGSPAWVAAVAAVGLLGGIVAVRNQPLTAIMTLPMLAMAVQARLRPSPTLDLRQRRVLEIGLATAVIISILVLLPQTATGSVEEAYPTSAFDRLEDVHPDARVLVDYDWGGYAIHRLHPRGGSVFIDGRSDMYPRHIFADYLSLRSAADGWETLITEYAVEAIVLPPSAPLTEAAAAGGWCAEHRDEQAVLLLPCGDTAGG